MIQTVRKHFILITMAMLTSVLLIPLCALNLLLSAMTYNQTNALLEQIAESETYALEPPEDRPPLPPEDHFFHFNFGFGKQETTTTITTTTTVTTTAPTTTTTQHSTATTAKMPPPQQTHPAPGTITPHGDAETPPAAPVSPGTTLPAVTSPVTTQPPTEPWTRPPRTTPAQAGTEAPPPVYTRPPLESSWQPQEPEEDERPGHNWNPRDPWHPTGAISWSLPVRSLAAAVTAIQQQDSSHEKDAIPKEKKYAHMSSSIDHFVIYLDLQNQVEDLFGTDLYTIETCQPLVDAVLQKQNPDGFCDNLQYFRKAYSKGSVLVFSDRTSDLDMLHRVLLTSIGIFLLTEIFVFFLTRLLTKRAMLPMEVAFEKQQQFISDAGHELKTPLTIISANADILSDEIGDNKWLSYIRSQTERMRVLVQEMLDLMKISNHQQEAIMTQFSLSTVVENAALPFESHAFEQHKTFQIHIQPDVSFFGNTEQIRRMVGIFIDNAFKYSNEHGTIQVELKTEGNRKLLSFYNTGMGIPKGEEEKIFERFYRSDNSRSRQTGSYGLGLAIAKSIADRHHIKIQVATDPGNSIRFLLIL